MEKQSKREDALINKFLKKYPKHANEINMFKIEILKTILFVEDIKKEEINSMEEMKIIYNGYSKCDKYKELFLHHSVVFHVGFMSKVYSIEALIMYLKKYHGFDRIDTKSKYMETVKEYLIRFETKVLRNSNMDKSSFVQYYSKEMEVMFDEKIKLSKFKEEEKKLLVEKRKLAERDQLRQNIKKINLEKMEQIMYKNPKAIF